MTTEKHVRVTTSENVDSLEVLYNDVKDKMLPVLKENPMNYRLHT
jgi:hypothetical protein